MTYSLGQAKQAALAANAMLDQALRAFQQNPSSLRLKQELQAANAAYIRANNTLDALEQQASGRH